MDTDTGIDTPDDSAPGRTEPGSAAASFCAAVVDEWIRMGATHAVVAPGSRSTPLAVALAARSELALHVFHDERSAAFAALGIGMSSGRPAILLCTSGTAAAHFHAAVIEAHQSDVPMIVCTADRPPELRDVGAPQTIDQTRLFGAAVRWFHDPGVASTEASGTWRSLAARAWSAATGVRPGPVHLNLPFREPLLGVPAPVPARSRVRWSEDAATLSADPGMVARVATETSGRRGIIVAGHGASGAVLEWARALGWPVFADARSGLRISDEHVVIGFDPLLRCADFVAQHPPEVVVRIGQPPASKVLAQWIASLGAPIIQIIRSTAVVDPDHNVALTVHADIAEMCDRLAASVNDAPVDGGRWAEDWTRAERAVQGAIAAWTDARMSEPTVARTVTGSLGAGANLVVSSSMPIRDVEWFGGATPDVQVHANRGANGIDGVVSTAVGVALASGRPTTLLIGDVACIHDANGMWGLAARGVDLCIVVVNNDGGSIFSFLPQGQRLDAGVFETLFGTPHGVSFASLAAAHGIDHVLASDHGSLREALARRGPLMVEIRFDRSTNVAEHEELNHAVAAAVATEFAR